MSDFGHAELGHQSRTKRAVQIAEAMFKSSSDSIPKMFADPCQAKGAYRFFSNPNVTHEKVLSGHMDQTVERCNQRSVILIIEDTTTLTYSTHPDTKGLGPINDKPKAIGMFVHTSLAISAEHHEVLGILDQHMWVRSWKRYPKNEKPKKRKKRRRESERWFDSQRRIAKRFEVVQGSDGERYEKSTPRRITVADREGDVFEVFEALTALGQGFVIRAAHNRLLEPTDNRGRTSRYSLDEVMRAPILARKKVKIPARAGRPAYEAELEIRAMTAIIQPPDGRRRVGESLRLNLVVAVESKAPKGREPLVWYLITSEPIGTAEDVLAVVRHYEARWIIEELHMGIKTGCACEKRQLKTFHALKNFVAMATVIAWQMLCLRDAARHPNPKPASEILRPTQLVVLCGLRPRLKSDCDAGEALREIAMMGGFMGRKSDGHPGWRTLWRGMTKLLTVESGYLLAGKNG